MHHLSNIEYYNANNDRDCHLSLTLGDETFPLEDSMESSSSLSSIRSVTISSIPNRRTINNNDDGHNNDNNNINRTEMMNDLLEAIRNKLPNLERLKLTLLDESSIPVMPYDAVARVIQNAKHLKTFKLDCQNLVPAQGDDNDDDNNNNNDRRRNDSLLLHNFLEALKRHASLKEFQLSFAQLPAGSNALNCLVEALSTIPTLEKLCMYVKPYPTGCCSHNCLSSQSTELLCGGRCRLSNNSSAAFSNLRMLKLGGFLLTKEHIGNMAKNLRTTVLRHLGLWSCNIDSSSCMLLADALRLNRTLEILDLSWNCVGHAGCIALAQALECNHHLKSLFLHRDKGNFDTKAAIMLYQAITQMLEQNFVLKDLWAPISPGAMMSDDDEEEEEEKKEEEKQDEHEQFWNILLFYLSLNNTGKRHILRNVNATQEEWIDTLVSYQNELPELFYYISKYPIVVGPTLQQQ